MFQCTHEAAGTQTAKHTDSVRCFIFTPSLTASDTLMLKTVAVTVRHHIVNTLKGFWYFESCILIAFQRKRDACTVKCAVCQLHHLENQEKRASVCSEGRM